MKNLLAALFALTALITNLGCPKPAPPPPPVKFDFDRPFALLLGQTGEASDAAPGFSIKFDKIASDSRCPIGVECITAGKVEVVLTLTKAGESQTVTLPFTLPNGTSNVTDFKGYTIRVMGVSPMKFKDKEIKPDEYSVLLTVTKLPPPDPKIKLGESFAIKVGERVLVEDDSLFRIRFDAVANDSRCPEGVECIWAGRADCQFTLMQGDSSSTVTLASGDMSKGGKSETKFGPYTLKVKVIAPPKKQGPPLTQKAYTAIMVLTK